MSTIFFDADELGNVAAALTAKGYPLVAAAEILGAYSQLNHAAYVTRYGREEGDEGPVTATEITAWATQIKADDDVSDDRALGMLGLAIYNLDGELGGEISLVNGVPAIVITVHSLIRQLGGTPRPWAA